MPAVRLRSRRARRLSCLGLPVAGSRWPPRASSTSRLITPSTSTASRCATGSGSSRRSTFPRTSRSATRSCCRGRPTASSPTARTPTSRTSAPRRSSATKATSWSTRTSAAAGCRRASSSTCGRTGPQKTSPQDIDESTDTYDTIDWLIKHVPNHNGRVGHVGHLLSRLLHRGGDDRRPSRRSRRPRPRRRSTDWFAGDDWHHNGAFFLPHAFNFLVVLRPSAPRADQEGDAERFDYGTPDGYAFFLRLGPLSNANAPLFQGRCPVLERDDAARDLR